jgi:hypothetical protein
MLERGEACFRNSAARYGGILRRDDERGTYQPNYCK